jgi:hypothetical protein
MSLFFLFEEIYKVLVQPLTLADIYLVLCTSYSMSFTVATKRCLLDTLSTVIRLEIP